MTAVVLPDLDAQTVEDLRPPCDVITHLGEGRSRRCVETAEWVVKIRCGECGTMHEGLQCDQHKRHFVDRHSDATCAHCHRWTMRYTCLSAERL